MGFLLSHRVMLQARCARNLETTVTLMKRRIGARTGPHCKPAGIAPSPSAVLPPKAVIDARRHYRSPVPSEGERIHVGLERGSRLPCVCVGERSSEELKHATGLSAGSVRMVRLGRAVFRIYFERKIIRCSVLFFLSTSNACT